MSAAMKAEDRAAEEAEETQSKSMAARRQKPVQSPVGGQGLVIRNNFLGGGWREAGLRPPGPHKPCGVGMFSHYNEKLLESFTRGSCLTWITF